MGSELPFGDKVILVSGDFRQTLPIVKGASRAGIVERCVNQHPLWRHFKTVELTINERVRHSANPGVTTWDDWLLKIGDGAEGDTVEVPADICIKIGESKKAEAEALNQLVEKVFPGLKERCNQNDGWINGRCILTPTNKNVDVVNHAMVQRWPGEEIELLSADCVDEVQDARNFSAEYLSSLNPTGLPTHRLVLKPGVPLMLLRNLEPGAGLCNGTRLIFERVSSSRFVLVCKVIETGKQVFIPRISLRPKEKEYAFSWSRRQFPVRLAFCSTVNKAQGDSLKSIGIWLPQPCFGHGQKYVAPSRVGSKQQCWYAIRAAVVGKPYNITTNVVYREVLQDTYSNQQDEMIEPELIAEQDVSTTLPEVEDISAWTDYEAVETSFDADLEPDLEEFGTPQQAVEFRRRISRPQPVPLSCSLPEGMSPPPSSAMPMGQRPMEPLPPLPEMPASAYELLREANIEEFNSQWLQSFGCPFNRDTSCLASYAVIPGYEEEGIEELEDIDEVQDGDDMEEMEEVEEED